MGRCWSGSGTSRSSRTSFCGVPMPHSIAAGPGSETTGRWKCTACRGDGSLGESGGFDAVGHAPGSATRRRGSRPDLLYGKPVVDRRESSCPIPPNPRAGGDDATVRVQSGLLQSVPGGRHVRGARAGSGGTPRFRAITGELELPVYAWRGHRFGGVGTADVARCAHSRSSPVAVSVAPCGSRVELTVDVAALGGTEWRKSPESAASSSRAGETAPHWPPGIKNTWG